jgi:hypothetical protein
MQVPPSPHVVGIAVLVLHAWVPLHVWPRDRVPFQATVHKLM